MPKWITKSFLVLLVLGVGYVLTVQVLRAIAFGEEEQAALALIEPLPPPPAGESGYKYLGFHSLDIPVGELDDALAADLAAYREWHAGGARRLLGKEFDGTYVSPLETKYPARPVVTPPEAECALRETDCLGKLRGHEQAMRGWLQQEAARLDLAWRALGADHLANPYPLAADSPIAGFQILRLPLNDISLQALEGDVPGALDRACGLLAAERRFLRQDGLLIDKMVHGALLDGASALVLALRRADPAAPLPEGCAEAFAPVEATDFLACGAFRHEHEMVATLSRQLEQGDGAGWSPGPWLRRLTMTDERLMRAWNAQHFVPLCSDEGQAAILAGDVPAPTGGQTPWLSVDFLAAPISRILADIALPSYDQYQNRLLDHAASLRLHLAALAVLDGRLPAADVPTAAASPGYTLTVEDGHWVLPLRAPQANRAPDLRIAIPQP